MAFSRSGGSSSVRAALVLVALASAACGGMHDDSSGVAQAQSGHATMRTGLDRTSSGLTTVQGGQATPGLRSMQDGMGMMRDGAGMMRSGYGMMGSGSMGMMDKCGSPSMAMDSMDQALTTIQDGYRMMADRNADDLQAGIRKCEAGVQAARMPMNTMDQWTSCMGQ